MSSSISIFAYRIVPQKITKKKHKCTEEAIIYVHAKFDQYKKKREISAWIVVIIQVLIFFYLHKFLLMLRFYMHIDDYFLQPYMFLL